MASIQELIYRNIGKIKHIKSYQFLKALAKEQGRSEDGWVRLTYPQWWKRHRINSSSLADAVKECRELRLIRTRRERKKGKAGRAAQAYKLNIK